MYTQNPWQTWLIRQNQDQCGTKPLKVKGSECEMVFLFESSHSRIILSLLQSSIPVPSYPSSALWHAGYPRELFAVECCLSPLTSCASSCFPMGWASASRLWKGAVSTAYYFHCCQGIQVFLKWFLLLSYRLDTTSIIQTWVMWRHCVAHSCVAPNCQPGKVLLLLFPLSVCGVFPSGDLHLLPLWMAS